MPGEHRARCLAVGSDHLGETGMYLVGPWVVPLDSAMYGMRPGQVRFSKTG